MKKIYKLFLIFAVLALSSKNLYAETSPHFIDFTKVLNQSLAGKEAQDFLKNKFKKASEKFSKQQEDIKKKEQEVIGKKKIVTNEEYQKLVQDLRKKVGQLQQNREKELNDISKLRKNARTELLKSLNPIIKEYMEKNKIRLVLDKKSILLGDTNLEITTQIIDILNKKVKSLNLK
jgi:outer membrane protein